MHRQQKIIISGTALFIAFLIFLLYLPALQNNFINWDDDLYVYNNPNIKFLNHFFLKWLLSAIVIGNWHPLTMFSYALDYSIWGLDPWGYHLTNNVFHSFNTLLVFILTIQLIKSIKSRSYNTDKRTIIAASFTAILFGAHPLHVESVAWISERKDVLCAFFYLLSLISYVTYAAVEGLSKNRFYFLCLLTFILALLSKPMAVSLPLVLVIMDYYPLRRFDSGERGKQMKKMVIEKIPFILLSLLSSIVTIWAQQAGGLLRDLEKFPFMVRLFVAAKAYIFYLVKMIYPTGLAPLYPHPMKINFFSFEYIGALAIFLIITYFCLRSIKRHRLIAAIWFYYVLTLLPVIGIVQVGAQAAADRYTYLPSLGPFLLAGLGVGTFFERFNKKGVHIIATVALIILVTAYANKSVKQIAFWQDSVSLWTHQVRTVPLDLHKTYLNRGDAYLELGKTRQAIDDYNRAIMLHPRYVMAFYRRADAYNILGNQKQALRDYNEAISLGDNNIYTYHSRGLFYMNIGNYEEAISDFSKVIEYDSKNARAYYNRGLAYIELRRLIKAIDDYSSSIKIDPFFEKAYSNRGALYIRLKRYKEAIPDLERAVQLDPEDEKALFNSGMLYSKLGNLNKARLHLKRASNMGLKEAEIQLNRLR